MAQPFDANRIDIDCPRCFARIVEPIGSFKRPYHCYNCGVLLTVKNIADLEREAFNCGGECRIVSVRMDRQEPKTPRMSQENRPQWDFQIRVD
jgi:hypothetical protein